MTKRERQHIEKVISNLESFSNYQIEHAKEKSEPEKYEGMAQGINHAIGILKEFRDNKYI